MIKRRNTRQRKIILDDVCSRCDHPDAEAIYNQVSKQDPNISLATVYRNLSVLADEGLINHIQLPDADRFDLTTEAHYHFICEKCGRLLDIPIEYNKELDTSVEGGFVIHSHQTLFKGLCPECANKKEEDK